MANQQTSSKSFNAAAGAILLSLGLLLFLAGLDDLAARVSNGYNSPSDLLGSVLTLGLATLHAVQVYFFDQPKFQAGLHLILVSFSPVILVLIGAALLQGAFKSRFASRRNSWGPSESEIAHE